MLHADAGADRVERESTDELGAVARYWAALRPRQGYTKGLPEQIRKPLLSWARYGCPNFIAVASRGASHVSSGPRRWLTQHVPHGGHGLVQGAVADLRRHVDEAHVVPRL